MKLLVVAHNAPSLDTGAGKRNYHLLDALSRAHDVSLLVIADDPALESQRARALDGIVAAVYVTPALPRPFKRLYQALALLVEQPSIIWRYSPPSARRRLRQLLAEQGFDAVLFESVITAGHHLPPGVRMIIDEHNIEYELLERSAEQSHLASRRLHYVREAAALKRAELRSWARADLILVTSERERALLSSELPDAPARVIPNGVDTAAFAPGERQTMTPGRVVFTGSMDYHPNEQAALFFAEQCWPAIRAQVPDATWHVVGRNPSPAVQALAKLPSVTVTGSVPETQPYLAEACVAIAPILVGSGSRLKILEALAMGKALVSTSVGYEGLDLTPGKHLLVADDGPQFAAEVIRLLRDGGLRAQLGAAGRDIAQRRYDWERIGDLLRASVAQMNEQVRERHVVLADS
ncbi:MAG TPA: glycosyltransferase [Ktedonobacterales bacterium]|nr:glycosyltransferase [Ktedonobacterales bacterium]